MSYVTRSKWDGEWDFHFVDTGMLHTREYRIMRYQNAKAHVAAAKNTLVYDTIGVTVLNGYFKRFYSGMKILALMKRNMLERRVAKHMDKISRAKRARLLA